MSKTIDEKVVEMRFDNSQFDSNVNKSMATIDKLNEKLEFKDTRKSISNISSELGSVSLNGLTSALASVGNQFSALEIAGMTAVSNLTNSIVNMAKRTAAEFTTVPVTTGFNEYELKMQSVQTIMAGSGASIDEVNGYLQELNTYSDKTIYSFKDMTESIGKFTNAGVKLKDAVLAIQGISNEAARSGANANEASRSMYNLAQALSSGYVKLIDWKSIELANMATVEFKQNLIDTAVEVGTLKKSTNGMYKTLEGTTMNATKNFNDTLADGWMTSKVLVNTLKDYADETTEIGKASFAAAQDVKTFSMMMDTLKEAAQSGWASTWELLIGDLEDAKKNLTYFANYFGDIIGKSADARNKLLNEGLSSGWDQFLAEGVFDSSRFRKEIEKVAIATKVPLDKYIEEDGSFEDSLKRGWLTADMLSASLNNLNNMTQSLNDATSDAINYTDAEKKQLQELVNQVKNGSISLDEFVKIISRPSGRENIIEGLKNSLTAISTVIAPVKEAFRDIFPAITGEQLYQLTVKFREFTASLALSEKHASQVKRIFKGVFSIFSLGRKTISSFANALKPIANESIVPLIDNLLESAASLGDWVVKVDETVGNNDILAESFKKIAEAIKWFSTNVNDGLGSIVTWIKQLSSSDTKGIDNVGNSLSNVSKPISTLTDVFKAAGSKIASGSKTVIGYLKEFGSVVGETLGELSADDIAKYGIGGGIAIVLFKIAKVIKGFFRDIKNITSIGTSINETLESVRDAIDSFSKSIDAKNILKIALSVTALAISLIMLSKVELADLSVGLGGMAALFGGLIGTLKVFKKVMDDADGNDMKKVSSAMVKLGLSILTMSLGLKLLSTIDTDSMITGLIGFAGIVAGISALLIVMDKYEPTLKGCSAFLLSLGVSVLLLSFAFKKLGSMDFDSMMTGLIAMVALLGSLGYVLSKVDSKLKGGQAVAIIALAYSLKTLASTAAKLGQTDLLTLAKGIGAIVIMLLALGAFMKMISKDIKNVKKLSTSFASLGASLYIMSRAILTLGTMNLGNLVQGMVAILAVMFGLTKAVKMIKADEIAKFGLTMIGMAIAIGVLSASLALLSQIDPTGLLSAVSAIAVCLTLLTIITKFAQSAVLGSVSILILSAAMLALSFALMALSAIPFSNLISSVAVLGIALVTFALAGSLIGALSAPLLMMCAVLAAFGVALLVVGVANTVFAFSLGLMATNIVLVTLALPAFVKEMQTLVPMAGGIAKLAGSMTLLGLASVICGAAFVVLGAGALLIGTVMGICVSGLSKLATSMEQITSIDGIDRFSDIGGSILSGAGKLLLAVPGLLAGGYAIGKFAKNAGKTSTSMTNICDSFEKMVSLIKEVPNDISSVTTEVANTMTLIFDTMVATINTRYVDVNNAVMSNVANNVLAIRSNESKYETTGKFLMAGFVKGVLDLVPKAVTSGTFVADAVVAGMRARLGIHSPATEGVEIGKYMDLGIAGGLNDYASNVEDAAINVGDAAIKPVQSLSDEYLNKQLELKKSIGNMNASLGGVDMNVDSNQTVTINHTFDTLHVEGVNDKNEFVSVADYSVERTITSLARRQNRV